MITCRLLLVLVVLMTGCAANPVANSAPPATQSTSSDSAQQLMDAFKQAHEKRDMETIRLLVYWEGVDAKTRDSVESGISADFGLPVKRIFIEKLSEDEKLEYTSGGVTYRPNLKPIGRMRVEFAPPAGEQPTTETSGYLVGVKDGKHFIATATPVSQQR